MYFREKKNPSNRKSLLFRDAFCKTVHRNFRGNDGSSQVFPFQSEKSYLSRFDAFAYSSGVFSRDGMDGLLRGSGEFRYVKARFF